MYNVSERYLANIAKNVAFTAVVGIISFQDGSERSITDKDIREGSLSINSKMNSNGEFRAGGVCANELSMTLLDYDNNSQGLDGAEIMLEFKLYTDSTFTEYDSVPLGIYIVDGSTIKRQANNVSFKAYDRLVLFDRAAQNATGTLYSLISDACDICAVGFGMTQNEFEALPNGNLSVITEPSRVQTCRDLLMHAGVITNSFAMISRTGNLVFKQLTCTTDDLGMVVPVKELKGDIRLSTNFSDSTARITKFVMNRNGIRLTSKLKISAANSECLTLEWADNPLLSELTDSEVQDILTTAISGIYHCINRAHKTDFIGDPALDTGDYVRLRGGQIDTKRGYATGMITAQTWRYRGKHTLQCNMPSTVSASETAAVSDDENEVSGRIQPKSQTEKRIDELAAKMGSSSFPPAPIEYKFNALPSIDPTQGGGFVLQSKDYNSYVNLDSGGVHIAVNSCSNAALYLYAADSTDWTRSSYINLHPWGINIEVASDKNNKLFIGGDNGDYFKVTLTKNGSETTLKMTSGGLYFNGKKVLTEE